jgi:hypothetical protein
LQLAHAGRKGSTRIPAVGKPLTAELAGFAMLVYTVRGK